MSDSPRGVHITHLYFVDTGTDASRGAVEEDKDSGERSENLYQRLYNAMEHVGRAYPSGSYGPDIVIIDNNQIQIALNEFQHEMREHSGRLHFMQAQFARSYRLTLESFQAKSRRSESSALKPHEEWRLETLAAATLGLPPAETADGFQVLPVRYYIDTDDESVATNVEQALDAVLDSCGFQTEFSYPVERGSFFRKTFYSTKEKLTPEEVATSLHKIERSAGVRALDLPQSEVDANRADGVAKLLTALESTPRAVIQIGSILLVKVDGTPIVMNLTPQELAELEREPQLFRSPCEVLNVLQKLRQDACGPDELPAV